MIRFGSVARLAATMILVATPLALAEDAAPPSTVPDELRGMVGDWVLEQEDADLPTCPITLTEDQAIGGWAVTLPQPCPAPFPAADKLVAWNFDIENDALLLLDAERHVTLRLMEDEDGLFDTDPDVQPMFYLTAPYDENGGEADSD